MRQLKEEVFNMILTRNLKEVLLPSAPHVAIFHLMAYSNLTALFCDNKINNNYTNDTFTLLSLFCLECILTYVSIISSHVP